MHKETALPKDTIYAFNDQDAEQDTLFVIVICREDSPIEPSNYSRFPKRLGVLLNTACLPHRTICLPGPAEVLDMGARVTDERRGLDI